MTILVTLNEEDTQLIKAYTEKNKISVLDLIRNTLIEKIEDEYDLECYNKVMKEYKKNPKTYTLEEVKKQLKLC